jgi:F0F1-type ATP synthase membrane subunit b/b'
MTDALKEYKKRERARAKRQAIDRITRDIAKAQFDRENQRDHVICSINATLAALAIIGAFTLYAVNP